MGREERASARNQRVSSRNAQHATPNARDQRLLHPSVRAQLSQDTPPTSEDRYSTTTKHYESSSEFVPQARIVVEDDDDDDDSARQAVDAKKIQQRVESRMRSQVAIAQAYDDEQEESKFWKYVLACILVLVIIAAGVVVAIAMVGKGGSGGDDNDDPAPAPTGPPVDINPFLSQDLCEDAVALEDVKDSSLPVMTIMGSNAEATADDSFGTCGDVQRNGAGVWYTLEGNDQVLSVDTCSIATTFDTQVSIFKALDDDNACGTLKCVDANDQRNRCGQDASQLFFRAEKGETYFLLVHGTRRTTGIFSLLVQETAVNDKCSDATELQDLTAGGNTEEQTTFGTTKFSLSSSSMTNLPLCDDVPVEAPTAWFRFQAQATRFLQARVDDLEARVSVYTSMTTTQGDCNRLQCVAAGQEGIAMFTSIQGTEYYIVVHGVGEQVVGDFALTLLPGGLLKPDPEAPTNVQCDVSLPISTLFLPKRLDGTTRQGQVASSSTSSCGNGVANTANGLWYSMSGTGRGMRVSTCDTTTGFDTQLSVYRGDCESLECVDGGDQNCGDQSAVVWKSDLGVKYSVFVQGKEGRVGDFNITIEEDEAAVALECTEAIPLVLDGVTVVGHTNASSFQPFGACLGSSVSAPSVWYSVKGTGNTLVASTCNAFSDAVARVEVYTGSCNAFTCPTVQRSTCGDEQMSISWSSVANEKYWIQVYGPGEFVLNVEEVDDNYLCETALPIQLGDAFSGFTHSVSDGSPPNCAGDLSTNLGLWYRFTSASSQSLTLSSCKLGTNIDSTIRVFVSGDDACQSLVCVGVNEGTQCGSGSQVTWDAMAGQEYYISVQGTGPNDFGSVELSLGPENDVCESAVVIASPGSSVSSIAVQGSTIGASQEVHGEDLICLNDGVKFHGPSVWYKMEGTGRLLRASTCSGDTTFDTQLSIFKGNSCDGLECVAGNDNACGLQSSATWFAENGSDYYLVVHGYVTGDFDLTINEVENNSCPTAEPLPSFGGDTAGFIPIEAIPSSDNDPCTNTPTSFVSSWYTIVGTGADITLGTCNGQNTPLQQISVITSDCSNSTCLASTQNGCSISFSSIAGEDYNIYVLDNNAVEFNLTVDVSNSQCESAIGPIVRGEGMVRGSNRQGTLETEGSAPLCDGLTNRGVGVWHSYVGEGRTVTAFTCSPFTNFDTQLSVYMGNDCDNLSCVVAKDDNCGDQTWATFSAAAGQVYYIFVSGKGASVGDYMLQLQ